MGVGGAGIELDGAAQIALRTGKTPLIPALPPPQRGQRLRQRWVELEGAERRLLGPGVGLRRRYPIVGQAGPAVGSPRMRLGVARIFHQGLLEDVDGAAEIGIGVFITEVPAP